MNRDVLRYRELFKDFEAGFLSEGFLVECLFFCSKTFLPF